MLTVCCFTTPEYAWLTDNLKRDCDKFGYNFKVYTHDNVYKFDEVDHDERKMAKTKYRLEAARDFDRVLFTNAESRIHQPFPMHWTTDEHQLILFRKIRRGFIALDAYSPSIMIYDKRCVPFFEYLEATSARMQQIQQMGERIRKREEGRLVLHEDPILNVLLHTPHAPRIHNEYMNYVDTRFGSSFLKEFQIKTPVRATNGSWTNDSTVISQGCPVKGKIEIDDFARYFVLHNDERDKNIIRILIDNINKITPALLETLGAVDGQFPGWLIQNGEIFKT